jgi:2-keto-3-deoxy-L-fuconate dehydrogenase
LDALRETIPGATHVILDHTRDEAVAAFASTCPELHGMFLCAGQLATGSVENSSVELFDRMIAANLRGPWLLCHHLGPKLHSGASVVLVGSNIVHSGCIGIRAIPDSAAYSLAKAGVHMLAKVLALEWGPRGIRCNAIAPGPVPTDMVHKRLSCSQDPESDLKRLASVNPMGRCGMDVEIAAMAAYLLSDESAWTSGAVIPVDGGATAVF